MPTLQLDQTFQALFNPGNGPVLVVNGDENDTIYIGPQRPVTTADIPIAPQASVTLNGSQTWYGSTLNRLIIVNTYVLPTGLAWDDPVGVQIALNNSKLAMDATVQATNSQLAFGVAPGVAGTDGGSQILQSPGTYTIYTFAHAGRIWTSGVSYAMGCTGGSGSQQGYARVYIQGGQDLAIVEACVAGMTDSDSNTDSKHHPGIQVPSGTVVKLDVNNGVGITGGVNRGSGLVGVSIP